MKHLNKFTIATALTNRRCGGISLQNPNYVTAGTSTAVGVLDETVVAPKDFTKEVMTEGSPALPTRIYLNALSCADGSTGTFVLFAIDKSMKSDTCKVIDVKKANSNIDVKLIIASAHSGYNASIKAYLGIVAEDLKRRKERDPTLRIVLTADGEMGQTKLWTEDEDVRALFKASDTTLVKLPAGTSMSYQPLDNGYFFRALKHTFQRSKKRKRYKLPNDPLLAELSGKLTEYRNDNGSAWTSTHVNKLAEALAEFIHEIPNAFKADGVMVSLVPFLPPPNFPYKLVPDAAPARPLRAPRASQKSFQRARMFGRPKNLTPFQWACSRLDIEVTKAEEDRIERNMGKLVDEFLKNGKVTDKFMNDLGLPCAQDDDPSSTAARDNLPVYRQRAMIFNDHVSEACRRELEEKAKEAERKRLVDLHKDKLSEQKTRLSEHKVAMREYQTAMAKTKKESDAYLNVMTMNLSSSMKTGKEQSVTIRSADTSLGELSARLPKILGRFNDFAKVGDIENTTNTVTEAQNLVEEGKGLVKRAKEATAVIERHHKDPCRDGDKHLVESLQTLNQGLRVKRPMPWLLTTIPTTTREVNDMEQQIAFLKKLADISQKLLDASTT